MSEVRVIPNKITVPFEDYIVRREATLAASEELPAYLLYPEIQRVLDAIHLDHYLLLADLLWQTGARVSEALALKVSDFRVFEGYIDVYLHNSKQRSMKSQKRSMKSQKRPTYRSIRITGALLQRRLIRYIKSHGLRQSDPLFTISRQAAHKFFSDLGKSLDLSIPLGCHTFRHSFAVNHLLHGQELITISKWLGHKSIHSTTVYLQVLNTDIDHLAAMTQFEPVIEHISQGAPLLERK